MGEGKEVILGVTFVQLFLKDTHNSRVADRGQRSKCSGEIQSLVNQPLWSCLTFGSQYTELIIKAPSSCSTQTVFFSCFLVLKEGNYNSECISEKNVTAYSRLACEQRRISPLTPTELTPAVEAVIFWPQ